MPLHRVLPAHSIALRTTHTGGAGGPDELDQVVAVLESKGKTIALMSCQAHPELVRWHGRNCRQIRLAMRSGYMRG
jgi:hypothetical protein